MSTKKHQRASHAVPTELFCTQLNCSYKTKKSLFAKQELGRHMRFAHKIAGATKSARSMQKKKELAVATAQAQTQHIEPAKTEIVAITKRNYTRRSTSLNGYDAQAFITVGKIIASCEAEAKKLGVPEESFTKRCAELFFASQIGA